MKEVTMIIELIPNIVVEILDYFSFDLNKPKQETTTKTIALFEHYLISKYSLDNTSRAKEYIYICDRLCDVFHPFECIYRDNVKLGYENSYYWAGAFSDGRYFCQFSEDEKKSFCTQYENAIFGFKYIYDKFKSCVLPIVHVNKHGDEEIGTGFIVSNRIIVTARHCIEHATKISFGKIPYDAYKAATIFYHHNCCVDVAVIITEPMNLVGLYLSDDIDLFDNVITMGYPKIPGYTCFQTAEKAIVSALPTKRLTVTEGQVAAEAQEIWSKEI